MILIGLLVAIAAIVWYNLFQQYSEQGVADDVTAAAELNLLKERSCQKT